MSSRLPGARCNNSALSSIAILCAGHDGLVRSQPHGGPMIATASRCLHGLVRRCGVRPSADPARLIQGQTSSWGGSLVPSRRRAHRGLVVRDAQDARPRRAGYL